MKKLFAFVFCLAIVVFPLFYDESSYDNESCISFSLESNKYVSGSTGEICYTNNQQYSITNYIPVSPYDIIVAENYGLDMAKLDDVGMAFYDSQFNPISSMRYKFPYGKLRALVPSNASFAVFTYCKMNIRLSLPPPAKFH